MIRRGTKRSASFFNDIGSMELPSIVKEFSYTPKISVAAQYVRMDHPLRQSLAENQITIPRNKCSQNGKSIFIFKIRIIFYLYSRCRKNLRKYSQ